MYSDTPLLVPWAKLAVALVAECAGSWRLRDWCLSYEVKS